MNVDSICEFRNTINNDSPLINCQLQNYEGVDLWNIVCSAMDWVEVSSSWLSQRNGPEICHDFYSDSMNLIFYLSAVDMLYEGVSQLYRVFYGILAGKKNVVLMENAKGVFSDIYYCKDDVTYFKELRAIFGEHSVKLNLSELVYPPEKRKEHLDDRWFASWSYGYSDGIPNKIFIYNRTPGISPIQLEIDVNEVVLLADTVYSWIPKITDKLKKLETQRMNELKKSKWKSFSKDDYENHIAFLLKENCNRSNNDWYRIALHEIQLILKCNVKHDIVTKYKELAYNTLDMIDSAIRNVDNVDIDELEPKEISSMPHDIYKTYGALCDLAIDNIDSQDYVIWGDQLREYVKDIINVDDSMDLDDQYVLITAALLRIENRL